MTMDKVAGLVFIDEFPKNPETPMAGILGVMDKSWRGMGDNQIDTSATPEGKTHFSDKSGHLFFRILINVAIIPS